MAQKPTDPVKAALYRLLDNLEVEKKDEKEIAEGKEALLQPDLPNLEPTDDNLTAIQEEILAPLYNKVFANNPELLQQNEPVTKSCLEEMLEAAHKSNRPK